MTEPALPDLAKLWDFSNPALSESRFRDVLPTALAAGDAAFELQTWTQIARAQGLQRKFDEAHATLDTVLARLADVPPVVRVRYLLERGRVFNSSGDRAASKPLFLEAWELARQAGEDNFAVDAAHMLGIVEPSDQALRWNETALQLAESSPDPKAGQWLGALYNNIGWTYHDSGRFAEALAIFEKARDWRATRPQVEPLLIARWCVARTLRSLGRVDEALAAQEALLSERAGLNLPDGYVFEEIGECLLALDRASAARPHFARAYGELAKDDWLQAEQPARLARLKKLGGCETK